LLAISQQTAGKKGEEGDLDEFLGCSQLLALMSSISLPSFSISMTSPCSCSHFPTHDVLKW
jgi:hypothetical protein